jgi:2-iminobutanoate/2-iminopropanoate deaminase
MEAISTNRDSSDLPFSQAIKHGDTIYVSGQGPIDPDTGEIVGDDAGEQTAQTLDNIQEILEAAGSSLDRVVRAGVYLRDMRNYDAVNEVYGQYVSPPYPARTAVEVDDLPVDIMVEIDVIAAV